MTKVYLYSRLHHKMISQLGEELPSVLVNGKYKKYTIVLDVKDKDDYTKRYTDAKVLKVVGDE